MKTTNKKAFTLLEILLVVAAIAILAGIVILAINPSKQLGDTKNAARKADVNTILSAIYQYSIDNNGTIPATITSSSTEICASSSCTTSIDLSVLTANEKYLTSMPVDPKGGISADGTGYAVSKSTNGRITVKALQAEQGVVISATR